MALYEPPPSDLGINIPYTTDETVIQTNTPSVFGQIGGIVQQSADTALRIRNALDAYQGKTQPVKFTPTPSLTNNQQTLVVVLLIAAVLGLVYWFGKKG